MGRRAISENGLREAPLLPGLAPPPSEDGGGRPVAQRGAAASDGDRPEARRMRDDRALAAPPDGTRGAEGPDAGRTSAATKAALAGQGGGSDETDETDGTTEEEAGHAGPPPFSADGPAAGDATGPAARAASGGTSARRSTPASETAPGDDPAGIEGAGPGDSFHALLLGGAGAPVPGDGDTAPARSRLKNPAAPPPEHLDHRRRLRERFMRGGAEAMPDYELLELVLFRAIPRQDVKPLAKRLLRAFGGFDEVISAPPARLAEVQGVGDAVVHELKIVEAAAQRLVRARILGRDVLQSWDQLLDHCRARIAREPIEQFRILFLDRKNLLIADESQGRGTVDHVPVYPREVVRRALELQASALILVHNHPSGDPTPSQADIDMTRRIVAACRAVNILVHDHVVVGRERVASFHDLGLLDG